MTMEEMEEQVEMAKSKKKKRKRKLITTIVIAIILIISGLVAAYFLLPKDVVEQVKKKIEPEKKLKIVDLKSNERPVAVMIDNNTGINNNNNHAGLQESYITYEAIVEGGLTRIMAVFKDKEVNLIGPVRSSRHYFLDYALESDAIYAHFGWSTYAENDIKALGVNNLNGLYLSAPYWRENSIAAPHNVFTTTTKLREAATNKGYSTTTDAWKLLDYSFDELTLEPKVNKDNEKDNEEEVETDVIPANNISIRYSPSQERSYTFDTTNKVYLRFMNGQPHSDKVSKEQLNYKNIIIERVSNSTLDSAGRQDLSTVGTGDGYYITNGYARPIKWSKSARNKKTEYTYNDGKKVKVNDGNTFIQIEPIAYTPDFS